jgi:hypothetical protein
MSAKHVVPERIISAQASDAPRATKSGRTNEPDVEPKVVGQAAKQRHGRMRVRVDKSGHHDASTAVECLDRFVVPPDLADGKETAPADGD